MLKRIQLLLFSLVLMLNFTSCKSLHDSETYPPEYRNKVKYVSSDDGKHHHLEYSGHRYYLFEDDIITIERSEDDVYLGWVGPYCFYKTQYFSSRMDDPVFMYSTYDLYLNENYDYTKDIFVIENISAEIVWEDMLYSKPRLPDFDFNNPITMILYSKQEPRISTCLKLARYKHQWYLSLNDSEYIWVASDKLINLLAENGIVSL